MPGHSFVDDVNDRTPDRDKALGIREGGLLAVPQLLAIPTVLGELGIRDMGLSVAPCRFQSEWWPLMSKWNAQGAPCKQLQR